MKEILLDVNSTLLRKFGYKSYWKGMLSYCEYSFEEMI